MATTTGPDMMAIDAASMDPLHGAASRISSSPAVGDMATRPPQIGASSRPNAPPPNPPFVFPARPASSSAPSSFSRATARRPQSAIEIHGATLQANLEDSKPGSRSPALPAFSFNPGASLPPRSGPESMFLSPPQSPSAPNSPRLTPARPGGHGHRRGGSEFVGGSIRDGEAITVMNTSPTKSDSGMPSPLLQPTRPRRGHVHRRSAAISSHDLSSIIVPPSNNHLKGTSAPPSPAVSDRSPGPGISTPAKLAEMETSPPSMAAEPPAEEQNNPPTSPPILQVEEAPKQVARNKVGFSDTLEYIPRPVSMVSTDTSSTVTARPGHSVSGSISSVISLPSADREMGHGQSSVTPPKPSDSRPSTAGAIMERTQSAQEQSPIPQSPRRRGSIPLLGSLPPVISLNPDTSSPTRSAKKWSFFNRDPCATSSPTRSQPDSPRSTNSHLGAKERTSVERVADPDPTSGQSEAAAKTATKKRSKKQKKVKSWAGSILSRKGKYRYGKPKRRTPTPPPVRHMELVDDSDDGIVGMSLEPEVPTATVTDTESSGNEHWETWTFPKTMPAPDEDASYPMIDLDAALGPFNTPLPRNPEWEAAQRAGGHVKKQLHSAAGMSRFSGPGMHYYHRRAESAPELVPFEGGRFGFRRFGSSSTMADVFEEDEEEEEESGNKSVGKSTPAVETPTTEKSQARASTEEVNAISGVRADTTNSGNGNANSTAANPRQSTAHLGCDEMVIDGAGSVCPIPPPTLSDNATMGSATPSPRQVFRPRDLAPVDVSPLALPTTSLAPVSPWSLTQSSNYPSPRSQVSYDAQCISTAPSSVTEDNFQSLLMGEPGPEVRISVDDIPSLTSSNSTMTRESLFAQHPQARYPPLNEQQRPASFTSTAFGRRRSSLASLSRLINSSHGERSKLSIEVQMDSEPEKKAKVSKTRRLSRMVQFWKSKETSGA
ncbi:hypothetical protein VTK26DRAFT_2640 [Humicola hyalothermophila]